MKQVLHDTRSRIPRNTATGPRLALRLSLEERAVIDEMAAKEQRSSSNMARMIFLRGLELTRKNKTNLPDQEASGMSGITININVNAPYVSLQKYAEITGIPLNTCKKMLADGRIIIRPKRAKMEKPEVNLVAMLKDALANS